MALIDIHDLSFTYDGSYDPVFEHVSVQLDTDWRLGLVGRNGRGKTTLLRLLMGAESYFGTITCPVVFDYFPFPVVDRELDSEQIASMLRPEAERWRLLRELSLLNLKEGVLFRPFSTLSNGEQTRFLLALLFLKEDCFLLIDEPTNHLDLRGREIVAEYLARKKGFLLVSHDRAFLDRCIDHVLAFNRTGLEVQNGNFSSWWENKERREQFERAEQDRLKKEISRLGTAARQTAGWSDEIEKTKYNTRNSGLRPDRGYIGHKAAKMMKRAKSAERRREAAVEEKSKLLKNLETAEHLKLCPLEYFQPRLVELSNVGIDYGEGPIIDNLSLKVERGDRVALRGPNGAGKSSVLKLILGEMAPHAGKLWRGGGLKMSYVAQDTSGLMGSLKGYARQFNLDESLFLAILRKLDFARVQFDKDMADYSEGQKKKVLLARSLCEPAHLYIWDEPLNFVDIYARVQLENLLLTYHPTMVFVEHDRTFTDRVATKIIEL